MNTQKKLLAYLDKTLPQTGDAMKSAIIEVLVVGATWRVAAATYGVTESGILRAMQRSKAREFLAGQQSTPLTD